MLYTNATNYSILIPNPSIQYIQWITYASFLTPFFMYVWRCGNKETMLKLYDITYFLIPLNLIQTIINLFSYTNPTFYILNFISNISILSILIAIFFKVKHFRRGDEYLKSLSIDFPMTLYYQTCIINLIFTFNQILYDSKPTLIYNENIYFGLMMYYF